MNEETEINRLSKDQLVHWLSEIIYSSLTKQDNLCVLRMQRLEDNLISIDQVGINKNKIGFGDITIVRLKEE